MNERTTSISDALGTVTTRVQPVHDGRRTNVMLSNVKNASSHASGTGQDLTAPWSCKRGRAARLERLWLMLKTYLQEWKVTTYGLVLNILGATVNNKLWLQHQHFLEPRGPRMTGKYPQMPQAQQQQMPLQQPTPQQSDALPPQTAQGLQRQQQTRQQNQAQHQRNSAMRLLDATIPKYNDDHDEDDGNDLDPIPPRLLLG